MSLFGEYTNLKTIAIGGEACIYKVRHNELEYVRALRALNAAIESEQDKQFQNFVKECKRLLRLGNGNHPNIVHIYQPRFYKDPDSPDGKAFVEMDYVDGMDLLKYLKKEQGFVPIEDVLRMLEQISSALAFCHVDVYKFSMTKEEENRLMADKSFKNDLIKKYRIVHNDIHSNNIMRRENGDYVLLDFGLAFDGKETVRSSLKKAGVMEFMAPEKLNATSKLTEKDLTPQLDIYGFGVVLYEYLAGKVPFKFKDESLSEQLRLKDLVCSDTSRKEIVPSIFERRKSAFEAKYPGKDYRKDYPDWLEEVIYKCLQKDPENRYADGKALYEDVIGHIKNDNPSRQELERLQEEKVALQQKLDDARKGRRELEEGIDSLSAIVETLKKDPKLFKGDKDFKELAQLIEEAEEGSNVRKELNNDPDKIDRDSPTGIMVRKGQIFDEYVQIADEVIKRGDAGAITKAVLNSPIAIQVKKGYFLDKAKHDVALIRNDEENWLGDCELKTFIEYIVNPHEILKSQNRTNTGLYKLMNEIDAIIAPKAKTRKPIETDNLKCNWLKDRLINVVEDYNNYLEAERVASLFGTYAYDTSRLEPVVKKVYEAARKQANTENSDLKKQLNGIKKPKAFTIGALVAIALLLVGGGLFGWNKVAEIRQLEQSRELVIDSLIRQKRVVAKLQNDNEKQLYKNYFASHPEVEGDYVGFVTNKTGENIFLMEQKDKNSVYHITAYSLGKNDDKYEKVPIFYLPGQDGPKKNRDEIPSKTYKCWHSSCPNDGFFIFNEADNTLFIPLLNKDKDGNYGSDRYIVYEYDGERFKTKMTNDGGFWIHSSLRDYRYLVAVLTVKNRLIRIDEMKDGSYRCAIWDNKVDMTDDPDLVMIGGLIETGSFLFEDATYSYFININSEDPTLLVLKKQKTQLMEPVEVIVSRDASCWQTQ